MTNLIISVGMRFGRFAVLLFIPPLVVPILLCLAFLDSYPIYSLIGFLFAIPAVGLAIMFVLGMLFAGLRASNISGVSKEEAPGLWSLWQRVAGNRRASRTRLVLTDELNAAVSEERILYGLGGKRTLLFIGLPVLAALDEQAVIAILAHEEAHLRRKDTNGMLNLVEFERTLLFAFEYAPAEETVTGKLLYTVMGWLSGPIGKQLIRLSRAAELDADRQSARAGGNFESARALLLVAAAADFKTTEIDEPLRKELIGAMSPPSPPLERFLKRCVELSQKEKLSKHLDAAWNMADDEDDDHPPWQDRLSALGYDKMPEIEPVVEPALPVLLDQKFASDRIVEFNQIWINQATDFIQR